MAKLTTSDVKENNKMRILQYIFKQKSTHQQMICESLQLSRPTVIPIIRECEELHIIKKNGFFESTGGRKATAINFIPSAKVALGVELLKESFEISCLNLYGETIHNNTYSLPFRNESTYFHQVSQQILDFIERNHISQEKILGIGFVLQALISYDGTSVTYGEILNCTGLSIDNFTLALPYKCTFFHDAEAAAQDELWQTPNLKNAIYMNIRSHVSGAIIVNRKFLKGTELKGGVFEHMTLVPNGRPCYCGHKGCVETYCSTQPLIDVGTSLDTFFQELRKGNSICKKVWEEYLHYLASAINNLHMFIDYPVILGGTLSPYLQGSDITALHNIISENTAFPSSREFIQTSKCPHSPISRGAALPYIQKYLRTLMGTDYF